MESCIYRIAELLKLTAIFMKNWKTRIIGFIFLAIVSVSSYSYLSMVTPQSKAVVNPLYGGDEQSSSEDDIYLPDVEMVNKIIEAGKKLKAFGR